MPEWRGCGAKFWLHWAFITELPALETAEGKCWLPTLLPCNQRSQLSLSLVLVWPDGPHLELAKSRLLPLLSSLSAFSNFLNTCSSALPLSLAFAFLTTFQASPLPYPRPLGPPLSQIRWTGASQMEDKNGVLCHQLSSPWLPSFLFLGKTLKVSTTSCPPTTPTPCYPVPQQRTSNEEGVRVR